MKCCRRIACVALAVVCLTWPWASGQNVSNPQPVSTQGSSAQPASVQGESPALEISGTEMDFGELWQGEPASREFKVKNVGRAPLTISVKSSCGCTASTKPKSPLAPGESDTLKITYDTLRRPGIAAQSVTLFTNDPIRPEIQIPVRGNVKAVYTAQPAAMIGFYGLRGDARETKTVKFENKYEAPLHFKLKDGQDFGPFELALKELKPGAEFELTATTIPPLPAGGNHIDVVIETGVKPAPEIRIPIDAFVRANVECSPTALSTSRLATFPISKDVSLRYREDLPIKITALRPSLPAIKCEALPPGAAQHGWIAQIIRVTLPPGSELPADGATIVIETDSKQPEFQKLEIRVQLVEQQGRTSATAPAAPPQRP